MFFNRGGFPPCCGGTTSFPFSRSSICTSRRIKSEGKHWSRTERIIWELQESLEPASVTLTTEWGTLLLTTPQVSDHFAGIYSVCPPPRLHSAATAHWALLSKWISLLVYTHTHTHICKYTQRHPGVKKIHKRPANSLQNKLKKKQWTKAQQRVHVCCIEMCKHMARNTLAPGLNRAGAQPPLGMNTCR